MTQCQREVPIAEIHAEHSCKTARLERKDVAGSLEVTLWLSVGANIMLTQNLWTAKGLTNGARGTVVEIIYAPGTSPPVLPLVILCHFPHYTGPSFETARRGIGAVAPSTNHWGSKRQFSRTQFCLRLCDAMTIHKAQGLTLDAVVVDIGTKGERNCGATFVALSRVRTGDIGL